MKNKKFIFYTLRDEISKISWIFGPGRHAMSVGSKIDDLGGLTSETSQNVSRLGTHRSNEWEGNRGWLPAIHAARDSGRNEAKCWYNNNIDFLKPPAFRKAPNVYNCDQL
jgi:hypothetical protein